MVSEEWTSAGGGCDCNVDPCYNGVGASTDMSTIEARKQGGSKRWILEDRVLTNGDEVELRLHGNAGWTPVRIEGLPELLRVRWRADDGRELHASLPEGAELRWP